MRGESASNNDQQTITNQSQTQTFNNQPTDTSSSPSPPPPPPRTKCDPYEQGGHPLTAEIVKQHMSVTLDPTWQYDESKRILVRSFEFGRTFPRGEAVEQLFSFVSDIGKIQQFGVHPIYNLNMNLRANSLQVMLRTVPLAGISYQDFILGTKIDGVWFRLVRAKEQKDQREKREEQLRQQALQKVFGQQVRSPTTEA